MNKLTVAHRIILLVTIAIFSMLFVGIVGLRVADTQTESIRKIDQDSLASIKTLSEARQAYMMVRINLLNHIRNTDAAEKKNC